MKKLFLITMILMSNILLPSVNSMIDNILKFEGSKLEQGGGSKYGITQQTLKKYGYKMSVSNVSSSVARKIYLKWYNEHFPKTSEPITNILMPVVFDTSINMGSSFANKTIVKSANVLVAKQKLEGKKIEYVDSSTVWNYLNGLSQHELKEINNVFVNLRVNKYASLSKQKKYKKYFNGWKKRALSFIHSA